MSHVKRARLRMVACPRCHAVIIEATDALRVRCDIGALDPAEEALAWLRGRATYEVRSLIREQYLIRRFCTRETARKNVAHVAAGTRPDVTVLAQHVCPGPHGLDCALSDWQPADRRAFRPAPHPPEPEEPAF